MRFLIGLPVAVLAVGPVFALAGTAPAQAPAQALPTRPGISVNYSCTAQTWAGDPLPTLSVTATQGMRQAQGQAKTMWGGTAKFATITCTPV
ncbi:hypothetical protein [Nocardia sp.]|uniref:hypothetical protein n=1 Tax=Nocardia sp. TaxID=1821 RepID=UPI0026090FF5|nr:hypothetical protein [Nocardia sp.]